eukprot:s1439_g3.t1
MALETAQNGFQTCTDTTEKTAWKRCFRTGMMLPLSNFLALNFFAQKYTDLPPNEIQCQVSTTPQHCQLALIDGNRLLTALGVVMPLCQFLTLPLVGVLSDAYGRKKALIVVFLLSNISLVTTDLFVFCNLSFCGSGETLLLPEHSKVGDLKLLAQKSFQRGFLKLITVDGHVLTNPEESLQAAGVQEGDRLTAVAQRASLSATFEAFALWCCGGNRVVTWGHPDRGGDCSSVQDQLTNVQQIQATFRAFAAILADGSVVAWGDPLYGAYGGDCTAVQDQLRNVQQVQATDHAFAGILADGSVVSWGHPDSGGDCSTVQDQLRNVQQVQATDDAFAAILADGSVVSWGDPEYGGDCIAVQDQLRHVQQIQATAGAFAAILADESVVAWKNSDCGGDCIAVQDQLRHVQQIQATAGAFAAILADGSAVAWGDRDSGGDCSTVEGHLNNVQQIQSTSSAFAAILADGSVVAWGHPDRGGDCSTVQDELRSVQQIQATACAFAAILADGSVVTWGDPDWGGDCSSVQDVLINVQQVQATFSAFAAILADGSVAVWGRPNKGGDCSAVQEQMQPFMNTQVCTTVLNAACVDLLKPRDRAAGMGIINALDTIAYVIGLLLGYHLQLKETYIVATGMNIVTAIYLFALFPETLPPEKRSWAQLKPSNFVPWDSIPILWRTQTLRNLSIVTGIAAFVDNSTNRMMGTYYQRKMDWSSRDSYSFEFYWDISMIVWMTCFFSLIVWYAGEVGAMAFGRVASTVYILVGVGLVRPAQAYINCCFCAGPMTFALPAVAGLKSRLVGEEEQGRMQAAISTVFMVAGSLGSLLGGLLFEKLGNVPLEGS